MFIAGRGNVPESANGGWVLEGAWVSGWIGGITHSRSRVNGGSA